MVPAMIPWIRTLSAEGILATIPAKISREMPLPTPNCVIFSPSHTRIMDPAVTVSIEMSVKGSMSIVMTPGR